MAPGFSGFFFYLTVVILGHLTPNEHKTKDKLPYTFFSGIILEMV